MDDSRGTDEPGGVEGGGGVEKGGDVVASRPARAAPGPRARGPARVLTVGAVGLGMGAAEVVPGFSGGTVALLTGIYEQLIANVRQGARALALTLRARPGDAVRAVAAIEWSFMVPLVVANLAAVGALAGVLSRLLESRPRELSAVFLGLVLGATVVAAGDLRRRTPTVLGTGIVVALAAFLGLGATGGAVQDPALPAYFGAGAVAVCAMILPGVSGSFLLVLLGMYAPVLAAVGARDAVVLGVVALGCLVGLAAFSTLLNWLLREHHDPVLAVLLGLLVGSGRVLWPWPGAEIGDPRLGAPVWGEAPLTGLLALAALAAVVVVGGLARRATRG